MLHLESVAIILSCSGLHSLSATRMAASSALVIVLSIPGVFERTLRRIGPAARRV